ncbi:MAG: hypothetical protein GWN37_16550 [Gammaproteobacteria bacterium]|nr:hypothetical protein [Gammaproteobacteria bacterium]
MQRAHSGGDRDAWVFIGIEWPDEASLAAQRLVHLLGGSAVTLSLRIESVTTGQRELLQRWLRRLANHGDRVYIRVNERLHAALAIDSSVFHLVLEEG